MGVRKGLNIFEAVATGDVSQIIAVADPVLKDAARKASARAHTRGYPVYDGRAIEEVIPKPTAERRRARPR